MRRCSMILLSLCLVVVACDDSDPKQKERNEDAGVTDAGDVQEQDTGDELTDTGDDATDADEDSGDTNEDGCLQAEIGELFENTMADDVSIEYSADLTPAVEGDTRELSLLFERYMPGPATGTYELGTGDDANFGTCSNCVFVRTDTRERVYFADRGTMVNNEDPYSRRLDTTVTNLRLIEATVDEQTRESTPVADGACIEVADFEIQGTYPPSEWTCPAQLYGEGEACNCECGTWDPDCNSGGGDCLPGDPACAPSEPKPVAGCETAEICVFNPVAADGQCTQTCDWAAESACTSGTCVFDYVGEHGDVCVHESARLAPATAFGETCPETGYQVVCNVVDGFAKGFCDPENICRPVCESDDDCTVEGESCQSFFFEPGSLGYCGPPPSWEG